MEFEWNTQKAAINQKKHGVSFTEAATVFNDPLAITFYDPDHSQEEYRYITIGLSRQEKLIIVSYRDRDNRIRIISARKVTPKERRYYEQGY